MYVCTHVYECAYVCAYIYMYIGVSVYIYIYIYICVCEYVCVGGGFDASHSGSSDSGMMLILCCLLS